MARKSLTEQDIAAIAAGVAVEAGVSPDVAPEQEVVAPEAVAETVAPESTETVVEGAGAAAETTAEVDIAASAIKFMKEQVKESQEALTASQIKVSKLEDKLAALEAVVDPLKDIAAKAVNNMRVACRASKMDMSAMNSAQVLAEYHAITPTFLAQFKAGGVAAVDAAQGSGKNEQPVGDKLANARINAVRFSK